MKGETMFIDTKNGSYLLGAVHGDGNVARRSIRISTSVPGYADVIEHAWRCLGFDPRRYISKYGLINIDVHNSVLTRELQEYKSADIWNFPILPRYPAEYLAGLIDTDGFVAKGIKYSRINITQKAGDKLPRIRPILDILGFKHIEIKRKTNNKVRGKIYPVDVIWWNYYEDVVALSKIITLRHPEKAQRMRRCIERAHRIKYDDKTYCVLNLLKTKGDMTIPQICENLGFEREVVLRILNSLRRKNRIMRNDPPIDSLLWRWINSNKPREEQKFDFQE